MPAHDDPPTDARGFPLEPHASEPGRFGLAVPGTPEPHPGEALEPVFTHDRIAVRWSVSRHTPVLPVLFLLLGLLGLLAGALPLLLAVSAVGLLGWGVLGWGHHVHLSFDARALIITRSWRGWRRESRHELRTLRGVRAIRDDAREPRRGLRITTAEGPLFLPAPSVPFDALWWLSRELDTRVVAASTLPGGAADGTLLELVAGIEPPDDAAG